MGETRIPVFIEEYVGIERKNEPVTIGIALPKGLVRDVNQVSLRDDADRPIAVQITPTSYWSDYTIKWILLDFAISVCSRVKICWWCVVFDEPIKDKDSIGQSIIIDNRLDLIQINTGCAKFYVDTRRFAPFAQVTIAGKALLDSLWCKTVLRTPNDHIYSCIITDVKIESAGPIRATIRCNGYFEDNQSHKMGMFKARVSCFAGSSLARFDFTIHNPECAEHHENLWDLGDNGSMYFTDLSTVIRLKNTDEAYGRWSTDPHWGDQLGFATIYQESSGGENWDSINHVNRYATVPHTFCGYKVLSGDTELETGKRVQPVVSMCTKSVRLDVAVAKFWQNFPKTLTVDDTKIEIGLFPYRYPDIFELQGGEQKTHTVYMLFDDKGKIENGLIIASDPVHIYADPKWMCQSGVFGDIVPRCYGTAERYDKLIYSIIGGDNSFFHRRELIDEYGWRNFGELYADHEAVVRKGREKIISHYNNQYDVIYGMIQQYVRSGDRRWYMLLSDLAHHVMDIDIYHTDKDWYEYSHGLFCHTDHHMPASTCTHRAYSIVNKQKLGLRKYGGAPSLSHNYTTGLMMYYYLTGDMVARESFLELIQWTKNYVVAPASYILLAKRVIKICKNWVTDLGSKGVAKRVYELDGPSQVSGNTLNALVDGYFFSGDEECLQLAQKLIQRCISPHEKIDKRDLLNAEVRWMYLVFLRSLVKYMRMKEDLNIFDEMYLYAKKSFMHYIWWMYEYEYPYLTKPERLKYPNETWGARDMHKCVLFKYAVQYAENEDEKQKLRYKAEFFYKSSLDDIISFKTDILTRPLALLLDCGDIHYTEGISLC